MLLGEFGNPEVKHLRITVRSQHDVLWLDVAMHHAGFVRGVDVFRNGAFITNVRNDGSFTDRIGGSGPGTFTYQVCNRGTQTCSNEATVTF